MVSVAQRQSTGLWLQGLGVRNPSLTPLFKPFSKKYSRIIWHFGTITKKKGGSHGNKPHHGSSQTKSHLRKIQVPGNEVKTYRAIVRKNGKYESKTFDTRAAAEDWLAVKRSELVRGVYVSTKKAEVMTLSEALDRYETEFAQHNRGYDVEKVRIRKLKNDPISKFTLAQLSANDEINKYRVRRLQEGAKPNTIRLEMFVISAVFRSAIQAWKVKGIDNPVNGSVLPKKSDHRRRRASDEEIAAVLKYSESPDLPALVKLALETGMRRGEISKLAWDRIDLKTRTATLTHTKNGKQRIVALTDNAVGILRDLPRRPDGKVFSITDPHSVSTAWGKAVARARAAYEKECQEKGLPADPAFMVDLHFHDLRHEATTRLFEEFGLNPMEVSSITGHETLAILKQYTHLDPTRLSKKTAKT